MDAHTGTPLTPLYSRDPPVAAAAAAAENPSAAGVGAGAAGAAGTPPTVGLTRSLFLPPRMTTPTGGVAPAPSRAAAAPSERKKGKTSAKKKTTDGSGSSKTKKKLAGRRTGAASTEAPASSLVEPAADAHHVFDEMPPSLNDDAYMSTMGVGSNNSHWSQTNDIHLDEHEFEVDEEGEGIVKAPKGRAGNYTTNDDKLLCNTWLQVSRDPSVGGDQSRDAYWGRMKEHFDAQNVSGIHRSERSLRSRWSTINSDCQKWAAAQKAVDKLNPSGTNEDDRYNIAQNLFKEETRTTKKGKIKKGKIFTLPHCYEVLKDDEKWKKREDLDDLHLSNKRKRTIELNDDEEDDASSDDGKRSPTPNSVSYSKPKRPDGCKKDKTEKKKRKGDDELTNAMEAIVKARKEANLVRKMARNQDAAAEERRLAAEERRVAAEERKVALEERKVGMEERAKLLEWEKHLFFLDTSLFNDAQKEYVNLAREEVLIQKRAMIRTMGGGVLGGMGGRGLGGMGGAGLGAMGGMGLGAMGGLGGFGAMVGMGAPPAAMGGMGGFGAPSNAMGGMGVFGAPSNAMGGMGGMSFASLMGGMGAPPAMGGMSFDVPHTHTHENAVEDLAKTVGATRDAVGDEVREEDSSSKAVESSSEEEEDDEEDD
uniref:No apical meristem-associated C-terminal domain-containing protein n=1 Tax=Hordeum vulgare subsp. vulgare TaxID=112509 RepID=A0A8I6WMB9_HORVV